MKISKLVNLNPHAVVLRQGALIIYKVSRYNCKMLHDHNIIIIVSTADNSNSYSRLLHNITTVFIDWFNGCFISFDGRSVWIDVLFIAISAFFIAINGRKHALLHKFSVSSKQKLKAINKPFSVCFVFKYSLHPWTMGTCLDSEGRLWLECLHKAPRKTGKCFSHYLQSSCTTSLNLQYIYNIIICKHFHITPMKG